MGLGKNVQTRSANPEYVNGALNAFGGWSPPAAWTVQSALLATPGAGAPWEINGNSYIDVYRGIMSIPGVWRAANLLADLLGSLEYDAYTTHGKDTPTLISPRPLLLEQPAPPDTNMTTFNSLALDLVLTGNAVAHIVDRDSSGNATTISPWPSAWTGIYRDLEKGTITYSMNGHTYDKSEVLHIKGPTVPGQIRGMGVLEAHFATTLALAYSLNRQAGEVNLNAVPTGVFTSGNPDLTPEDAEATKHAWQRSMSNGSIAVVGPNDKFQALSWNPTERQLIEARQFSLSEIALIFGLPPSFLNTSGGTSMTYSNVESDAVQLLKFSLQGHLTRIEQAFSACFPRGTKVRADLDTFLRSDTLSRYQAYLTGIESGWLQRSEVRTKENLPAIEGIDDQAETDFVQLKLNKTNPVTTPSLLQPKDGRFDPANPEVPVNPVQAASSAKIAQANPNATNGRV